MRMMEPAGSDVLDSPYAWLRLVISMVLGTAGGAGMWAVVVVRPDVQAEFGVDRLIDRLGYWRPALAEGSRAIGDRQRNP